MPGKEDRRIVATVPFLKYTSYGNNFLIVDETRSRHIREEEKPAFARQVTDVNFGVGADGVLFLQPCRPDIMREINETNNYWEELPAFPHVNLMFRLFEPNGEESFSCGNGLMCVASYLYHSEKLASTRILTQVPTSHPKTISIGTNPKEETNWANMGTPKRVPREVADLSIRTPLDDAIDVLSNISITFRAHDLHPYTDESTLNLTGYLVYTGEPHLVIFPQSGFSNENLKNVMFVGTDQETPADGHIERRVTFGSWLIHHIGTYLNHRHLKMFPRGINVDFVQIPDENVAEYRCYERGINKETLACGTGALAVSFVARHLGITTKKQIDVWPHRSRWYQPQAHIRVEQNEKSWLIHGKPEMLLEGEFFAKKSYSDRTATVHPEKPHPGQGTSIQDTVAYPPLVTYH